MIDFTKFLQEELVSRAISLDEIGVNEVAWKRDDALEVLKALSEQKCVILGGDVLVIKETGIEYTYDNWFSDKKVKPLNDWSEKVRVSAEIARKYINKYHEGKRSICYTIDCVTKSEMESLKTGEN